jgi:hypothetical protein
VYVGMDFDRPINGVIRTSVFGKFRGKNTALVENVSGHSPIMGPCEAGNKHVGFTRGE